MAFSVVTKPAVIVIASLLMGWAGRPAPEEALAPKGRIRVTVLDTLGRLVPNISIIIEGNGTKITLSSDDDLNYEFELPAGLYQITSQKGSGYYFPFRRAPFRIVSGTKTLINVMPVVRIRGISLIVGESGSFDSFDLAPEPKYQSMTVPHSTDPNLILLVQYDHSRDLGEAIEYTGGVGTFSGATVSYDALTLSADRITIDKDLLRVRAEGNVIVEDGKQRIQAKQKILEFRNGIAVMPN
jgi:hypothetical protein